MTSRTAVERKFFAEHPGGVFDEAWHRNALIEASKPQPLNIIGREKILTLEREIGKLPQYDCPLKHYFVDGLYVREIFIPAGCALVGYIHMQPCITTVSRGKIVISDVHTTRLVEAPFTMSVQPGSKKAGYAIEDTVWSDAYVNVDNETCIEKLEARLTANSHDEFLLRLENKP